MEHLIERNKNYWKTKHSNDLIRLQKSSDRHNKNIFDEQKRLQESFDNFKKETNEFINDKINIMKEKVKNIKNQL